MGIFLKNVYSKIDVFVKFESAINLEIKVQIKKKIGFLLFGSQGSHMKGARGKPEMSCFVTFE